MKDSLVVVGAKERQARREFKERSGVENPVLYKAESFTFM